MGKLCCVSNRKGDIMLPVETQENIIAEWESFIDLLIPVIDSPEENTESFDEEADYAQ